MADEEVAAPKSLSIAEALKEGVKGAQQTGALTFEELDGASRAAVVLLAVGAESAANVLRTMTPFEVQRLSGKMAVVRSLSRDLVLQVLGNLKKSRKIILKWRLTLMTLCRTCSQKPWEQKAPLICSVVWSQRWICPVLRPSSGWSLMFCMR